MASFSQCSGLNATAQEISPGLIAAEFAESADSGATGSTGLVTRSESSRLRMVRIAPVSLNTAMAI
ncbi:MAG: hypothetical protein NTX58_14340, partial [Actinobacteria bacterium]|nr:hypothetical protein [Actinomycetota bacterium]